MYDLHCHILPGIDDGASSTEEALAMLRLAQQQGISHMVATPHIQFGQYDNNVDSISQALNALKQAAQSAGISVQLAAAAELRVDPQLIGMAEQKALPLLGHYQGDQVILLEFPHSHIPPGSDNLIQFLAKRGYRAMIAHPERNRELQQAPEKISQLKRLGCLFQLTAASLLGVLGERPMLLAQRYLREDVFTLVATDCHSLKRRPPQYQQTRDTLTRVLSEDTAQRLLVDTPRSISQSLFAAGGLLVAS